jgi:hypothetical protein
MLMPSILLDPSTAKKRPLHFSEHSPSVSVRFRRWCSENWLRAERLAIERWLALDIRVQPVPPEMMAGIGVTRLLSSTWSPRRWLGPCPSGPPLQISVLRRPGMREQLEAEFSAEVAFAEGRDDAGGERVLWRKSPQPQGFWSVKKDGLTGRLIWKDRKWEPSEDVEPPESVLLRVHEPPKEPEAIDDRRAPFPLRRPSHFYYRQYWTVEDDKIVLHEPKAEPVSAWRRSWRRVWGRRFPLMHSPLPECDPLDRLAISAAFEAA